MRFFERRFVQVYLVPGAVLQSVIVGGGYGTGREIVEYFTQYGAAGGLIGMLASTVFFAIVLAATYEFARCFQVYDYRRFFKALLGRAWPAFEVLYLLMLVLVLAVVASAAGEILQESFGIPYAAGLGAMLVLIAALVFYGREVIARVLTVWSAVLYVVFAVYFVMAFTEGHARIAAEFARGEVLEGWLLSGFKYTMYNVAIVPAVLFAMRGIETRREALASGGVSALIIVLPAVLFHITFAAGYPEVLQEEVPLYAMTERIGAPFLLALYVIVLFGTFIETGAGFIQGLNERIDAYLLEKQEGTLSNVARTLLAIVGIGISAGLATLGIVTLIADGYGLISWGFFAVYVLPVVTYGVYRIATHGEPQSRPRKISR